MLIHECGTIIWQTKRGIIKTMHNVTIYDDGNAYRIYFTKIKNGGLWKSNKRVWKKNVITVERYLHDLKS
jgi:hypothetical protein